MKKTKLTEKPSRIPDISEQSIAQKFEDYIEHIRYRKWLSSVK
jgi:hypothetical protein